MLGLVTALQFAPVLFLAPYGGLLAGRFSKRKMLIITQSAAGLLALVLGMLVATNTVQLWMVYAIAAGLGVVNALDNPVRQTFVHELVGHELLGNAVTLNSIELNLSRVIGPAFAGIRRGSVRHGALLHHQRTVVRRGAGLPVHDARRRAAARPSASRRPRGSCAKGSRTPGRRPSCATSLIMMALVGTLTYEFRCRSPLLADITFRGPESAVAGAVALLMSAMGVGAVVGGLVIAGKHPRP